MVKLGLHSPIQTSLRRKNNVFFSRRLQTALCLIAIQIASLCCAFASDGTNDGNNSGYAAAGIRQTPNQITLRGRITDEKGAPLIGATVLVKGTTIGVASDPNGNFVLNVPAEGVTLMFSYIGYEGKEVVTKPGVTVYDVSLSGSVSIETISVVDLGIMTRDVHGFTGSVARITKEELKTVGFTNPAQALTVLDPSFVIVDNNLMGSNPNVMPTIELRGKTSLTSQQADATANPNTPIFIIDGFEATLEEFNDLDIHNVQSISLLKDAGSTAIYGSRGANGVVVVETEKPLPGKLRVSYNTDLSLNFPDLDDYNLMNAAEKLEYERQAGAYDRSAYQIPAIAPNNYSTYFQKLELIKRGLDVDWLHYPLRNAFTNNHSLRVTGGDGAIVYAAHMHYMLNNGVVKDSKRDKIDGDLTITYRRKRLSVTNKLMAESNHNSDGSWESVNKFAEANPYFSPKDELGYLKMNLNDQFGDTFVANPLYNSSLLSERKVKGHGLQNNTRVEWNDTNMGLRAWANLSIKRSSSQSIDFKDPRHTDFRNDNYTKRGNYSETNSGYWNYSTDVNVSYNKTFNQTHSVFASGRADIGETHEWSSVYKTEGFPDGVGAIPEYSYSYPTSSRPTVTDTYKRRASFVFTGSYNYKLRYMLDVSLSIDGSSVFGRNNPFKTNWSVGAGWNINREKFAEGWDMIDMLKVRASYGTAGNQKEDLLTSSVYKYHSGSNWFGQSSYLYDVANPDIAWVTVKKLSIGFDLMLARNRLNLVVDLYRNLSDPLAIKIPHPSSTGLTRYPMSLGHMTSKGLEFKVNYRIINRIEIPFILAVRINGAMTDQRYGGINNIELLNPTLGTSPTVDELMLMYKNGGDPDAMYAVRSLGIDPATGRELLLTKDGVPTYFYSTSDRVEYKSARDKLKGTFGINLTYKRLTVNVDMRYAFGGYKFNEDLFNRVENVTSGKALYKNQDKRAFTDRWKEPGDIAKYKNIRVDVNNASNLTTRFIQKNNYIESTNITATWRFSDYKWVQEIGLQGLDLSLSSNNLVRLSTIKRSRGTQYPFQRTCTLKLSCAF